MDKIWDRFEVKNITLKELIEKEFEPRNLQISMVSSGVSLLYAVFFPLAKKTEREGMKLIDLVELVSKKAVPAHQKYVIFEVVAEDGDGEDVEVPYVRVSRD